MYRSIIINTKMLKPSLYNVVINEKDTAYWYNTFSRRFFTITRTLSSKVLEAIQSKSNLSSLPDTFIDKLAINGFLVPQEINELEVLKKKYQESVLSRNYFLVILPTLNCNFNCWYCIQDHKPSVMEYSTIRKVCAHISYMVEKEQISFLHIEWFGGEPLMYVKKIIEPIASYAQDICAKHNIPFFHSATTNGYFLSQHNIQILSGLNCKRYQITLDGPQALHDSIKFQHNCPSAFSQVLTNINNLLKYYEHAEIILRINYSLETIQDELADQIASIIDESLRYRITITPKQVWQVQINHSIDDRFYSWLQKFDKLGFKTQKLDIVEDYLPCYANKKYYNAINYNGDIVKCTACDDLYSKRPKGILLENGEIEWIEPLDKLYTQCTFNRKQCLECNLLPICMGQCPREHLKGHFKCKHEEESVSIRRAIIEYIKNN